MNEPAKSITLRCDQCGSPLAAVAEKVACGACGHWQSLDPAQLALLRQYQRDVRQLNQSATADVSAISRLEILHGGRGPKSRNLFLILLVSTSVPVVVGMGIILVGIVAGVPNDTLKAIGSTVISLGSYVGIGIFFIWYFSGERKKVNLPSATQAAICPSCGAPTAFMPGEVLTSCQYCGTSALAGTLLRRAGVEESEHVARLARLARYSAERSMATQYIGIAHSSTAMLPWVLGLSFGMPIIGCAGWATWSTVEGTDPAPMGVLVGLWLFAIGGMVGGVVFLARSSNYRNRWHLVQEELASALNGVSVRGSEAATKWLDTFWACPFPAQNLFVCPLGSSTLALHHGFPVLLLLNPVRPDESTSGNTEAVLAAKFPNCSDDSELPGTPALTALREWLGSAGLTLKSFGGGLHATAATTTLKALRANPEEATVLLQVVDQLAEFAGGAGAQPAAPMASQLN